MKNPYPGLLNPYSGTLLILMIVGIVGGGARIYNGNLWGLIPLILGMLLCIGFKWPEEAKPRRVWLITFFGQMTAVKTDGITLLLDWIPMMKIIGNVEFILLKKDIDINFKKPIRGSDGKYVEGFASVSIVPDELDDEPGLTDRYGDWKSGGEKLRDFGNTGTLENVVEQLDDILTTQMEAYARANGHTTEWLEEHGREISEELLPCITGLRGPPANVGNHELDDTRGFGIRFTKFQIVLRAPDKVIEARTNIQVTEETRKAELVNTETVNRQIVERLKLYRVGKIDENGIMVVEPTPTHLIPSLAEIRNMIFQENLEHDGKVSQVINQGGINMLNTRI